MPLDAFLRKMFGITGFTAFISAMPRGAARRANLIALAEAAGEYEAFGGEADGFVQYIRNSEKKCAFLPDGDNSVKIITIHKSKGLEFPIVILPYLNSRFNDSDKKERAVLDRRLGIGLKVTDRERRLAFSPFCREAVAASADAASKSEDIRLLYVALTRARESLFMLFADKNPESLIIKSREMFNCFCRENENGAVFSPCCIKEQNSYADWILPAVSSDLRKINGGVLFKTVSPKAVLKCDAEERIITTDDALVKKMADRMSFEYPYAGLNSLSSKYSVTGLLGKKSDPDFYFSSRPRFMSSKGLTPSERGTAMHLFLETANFKNAEKDIETEIKRLKDGAFLSVKQADSLDRDKLRAFFKSGLYQRISHADSVYREMRFMSELEAKEIDSSVAGAEDEKVVIQGIADCVIAENGSAVIIDYKTDAVKNTGELAERYSEQLRIYSAAISKILGIPVKQCIIYSLFLSETAEITNL